VTLAGSRQERADRWEYVQDAAPRGRGHLASTVEQPRPPAPGSGPSEDRGMGRAMTWARGPRLPSEGPAGSEPPRSGATIAAAPGPVKASCPKPWEDGQVRMRSGRDLTLNSSGPMPVAQLLAADSYCPR